MTSSKAFVSSIKVNGFKEINDDPKLKEYMKWTVLFSLYYIKHECSSVPIVQSIEIYAYISIDCLY